jgi:Protein of unknown function (DUF3179)
MIQSDQHLQEETIVKISVKIKTLPLIVAALPVALIALVLVPLVLDRPFGTQTPRMLAFIHAFKGWLPVLTAIGAGVALVVTAALWRRWRLFGRLSLASICVVALGCTWFARQNVFEWMFNPLPRSSYAPVAGATFVDARDVVLAVSLNGDAAAYPVRQLAYHHIVHDVVGGVPLVVTY